MYANEGKVSHVRFVVSVSGGAFPPEFADTIQNVTVSLGRDATFTCLVNHLGGYRVSFPICCEVVPTLVRCLVRVNWRTIFYSLRNKRFVGRRYKSATDAQMSTREHFFRKNRQSRRTRG